MNKNDRAKRLELGDKMVETWTSAGRDNHKSCLFVAEMLVRLRAGKGMSAKQLDWYDSAVTSPPPPFQNQELVQTLNAASAVPGMESCRHILADFARMLGDGRTLSAKQQSFCETLLDKARKLESEGLWVPTAEERAKIETVMKICRIYSSYYLANRPGLRDAIRKCLDYINGASSVLDRYAGEKVMNACKGKMLMMAKFAKRCPPSTLATVISNDKLLTIVSEPYPDNYGRIVIDALYDGKLTVFPLSMVKAM
jgi:hypothetical protein